MQDKYLREHITNSLKIPQISNWISENYLFCFTKREFFQNLGGVQIYMSDPPRKSWGGQDPPTPLFRDMSAFRGGRDVSFTIYGSCFGDSAELWGREQSHKSRWTEDVSFRLFSRDSEVPHFAVLGLGSALLEVVYAMAVTEKNGSCIVIHNARANDFGHVNRSTKKTSFFALFVDVSTACRRDM